MMAGGRGWALAAAAITVAGCVGTGPADRPAHGGEAPGACADPGRFGLFRPRIDPVDTVPARGLAVTPSGGSLLILGADGATRVWDLANGRQHLLLRPDSDPELVRRSLGGEALPRAAGWTDEAALAGGWRARRTDDGRIRFDRQGVELDLILSADGWAVLEDGGRFDGTPDVLRRFTARDGALSLPLASLADPYFEPGLLGYRLGGTGTPVTGHSPRLSGGIPSPPAVTVTVEDGAGGSIPDRPVTVAVRAEDRGGCVGRVSLFHNGKAVPGDRVVSDGTEERDGRSIRTVRFAVRPVAGTNDFEAVAASALKVEGERARVSLRAEESAATRSALHVLAVGINRYSDPRLTLNYAVADARGIAHSIADPRRTGALFADVRVRTITDRDATAAAIGGALADLRQTRPEDVVVIYLAGHGENDGELWYFLPTEFGRELTLPAVRREGVSSRTLKDALADIGAQRVVLLIDACKSGAMRSAFAAEKDEKYLEWVARTAGVHVLAATAKDQLAVEIETLGHGAFTYALIDGIGGAAGRGGADRGVRATDLLRYATETVPKLALRFGDADQRPTAFSYGRDVTLAPPTP